MPLAAILPRTLLLLLRLADDPPEDDDPIIIVDRYGNPRAPESTAPARTFRARAKPPAERSTRCPAGMALVMGGKYSGKQIPEFCLDIHEVTVAAFDAYLRTLAQRATAERITILQATLRQAQWTGLDRARDRQCTWPQAGKNPDLPINCISHAEAETYCTSLGKRLPSEQEWKWAARGGSKGSIYSWGKGGPTRERVNMAHADRPQQILPVAAYDPGAFGLHDMAGNLWEWTAGDPTAPGCTARGGGYRSSDAREVKATAELEAETRQDRSDEVGFRCAASAGGTVAAP